MKPYSQMRRGPAGRARRWLVCATAAALVSSFSLLAQQPSPGAGPTVVLETARGVIEFETYPEEAPKTVAQILDLVKRGFYNGQRFHRAEPNFLVQVGDPQSRDMTREAWWGRSGSGKPIGVAEFSKKRRHVRGAVGMAHAGTGQDAPTADSQFYITLRPAPDLDKRFVVFGRVTAGMDVVSKIQKGDILKKASVKEAAALRAPSGRDTP